MRMTSVLRSRYLGRHATILPLHKEFLPLVKPFIVSCRNEI